MKVKLLDICHARSGDKGDAANVGLIAREERYYPVIKEKVTKAAVKKHFKGICFGPVERFELPNLWALNFLLHNTLGGGGTVSLKQDAQGKTLAAALLRMEIDIAPAMMRPAKQKSVTAPAKPISNAKTVAKPKLIAKPKTVAVAAKSVVRGKQIAVKSGSKSKAKTR